MGLLGRKRKVGDAGIPGTGRVLGVDTEDFWRDSPGSDHTHLAEFGLGNAVNDLTPTNVTWGYDTFLLVAFGHRMAE